VDKPLLEPYQTSVQFLAITGSANISFSDLRIFLLVGSNYFAISRSRYFSDLWMLFLLV
jgi:hypothetical protein